MKNLVSYPGSCFDIHQKAVSQKESEGLRDRLTKLDEIIRAQFDKYEIKFAENKISELVANPIVKASKDDFLELYSYQSSVIREVRKSIRNLQVKTIISTCQNCTVTPVSTMDHVLPKSKFPEFIVNPRNLFPCCSICNGHKLTAIDKDGGSLFLNLYLDKLPEEQYLFVNIWLDADGEIDYCFYLENKFGINEALFNVIKTHYKRLNLFERMKLKSIEGVGEFENGVKRYSKIIGIENTVKTELEKIAENKSAYGENHWKCVLEQSLLESKVFIDKIK